MSTLILRSRLVIPISRPPIDNGVVVIEGSRITAVGSSVALPPGDGATVRDLGESILLPGLINCHCHFDYTDMAGLLPSQKPFTDWIRAMIALKANWNESQFASSWARGARMLEGSGTTSVVNIESLPQLLPDAWKATPLRLWSCLELINIHSTLPPEKVISTAISQLPDDRQDPTKRWGLSPHAPYSTTEALRQLTLQRAEKGQHLITTHVAESDEEFDLYENASGALFDWLHPHSRPACCGTHSPVGMLDETGYLTSRLLVAHCNRLATGDEDRLSRAGCSVVHCPRSHAYFDHHPFPWQRLDKAGVNLTLGTDSLASTSPEGNRPPRLDLFAEMAQLAGQKNAPEPKEILRWATLNGAKAIHQTGRLGELREGALADLIAVPYSGPATQADDYLVHFQDTVTFSMINGKTLTPPRSRAASLAPSQNLESNGEEPSSQDRVISQETRVRREGPA